MSRSKLIFLGGSGTGGTGDVTGPASSTANAVALFNGTGGKTIKDSTVLIDTAVDLAGNADTNVSTQKAVKTYVDTADALLATKSNPVFSNLITLGAGATAFSESAMGALSIDVTKRWNTKSISSDSTVTFSGTPASSPWTFGGRIKNTDVASHTVTFPSTFSINRQSTAAHVVTIPAGGRIEYTVVYDGTDYELFGDPVRLADLSSGTPAASDLIAFSQAGVELQAARSATPSYMLASAAGTSTLSAAGAVALNTTDKQIGVHNGTKEVAIPLIQCLRISFDPKAVCDGAVDRLFLMSTGVSEPKGITVVGWKLSFEADPTTEIDLDLKRADAFIGVANSAVMDVLDTTAGASSETTAANINSGAVVANGKVIYLEFGTAYTEANHQCIFEMWYEVEED